MSSLELMVTDLQVAVFSVVVLMDEIETWPHDTDGRDDVGEGAGGRSLSGGMARAPRSLISRPESCATLLTRAPRRIAERRLGPGRRSARRASTCP